MRKEDLRVKCKPVMVVCRENCVPARSITCYDSYVDPYPKPTEVYDKIDEILLDEIFKVVFNYSQPPL